MNEAHHGFPLIEIAIVIVIAVVAGLGLMRLRQPPLVGFILAGVVMGPTGFGLIANNDNVTALAEMGVLVLLFFIGTELSLKAFVSNLKPASIVALGQLGAAMLIGAGIAWLSNSTVAEAITLGFIIALSSTVVAMKMLDDMGALRKLPGRIAVAVLIAQDIAVVPMLILVSSIGGAAFSPVGLVLKVALSVGLLGVLLWWLGRTSKIKVPFDEEVGENVELLALASLAICFTAAAISGLIGLSPAYGAFVAGLIIGNSTLRNRVIPVIEPIQSVLLVMFFLSIGLLIDLKYVREHLIILLPAAFLVIAIKSFLNVFLLRLAGFDRQTALVGGLSMAQIGEFSFVLAASAFAASAIGYDTYRLSIAVTAITLLVSPAWMAIMRRIEEVAVENYTSYREALSEAYGDEIENVGEGLWWLKVRYRAGRIARHKRRLAKLSSQRLRTGTTNGQEASKPDTGVEEDG